jgi:hypothetical protein
MLFDVDDELMNDYVVVVLEDEVKVIEMNDL